VRIAPTDPQSHNLMGMVLTETNRPQFGEFHYRRVLALLPQPSAVVLANLGWNLKNQGRMAESRQCYEASFRLDPALLHTVLSWAKMEETDRNVARALELLDAAERLAPGHQDILLARATLQGRTKAYADALRTLDAIAARRSDGALSALQWSEKGQLLDKMGRFAEAFAAFDEGKRRLREATGQAYQAEAALELASRLKRFFTAKRLALLPRAGVAAGPQPIFILGFPRSGTTMVEQTLSAHPAIAAGDELTIINDLAVLAPGMLSSPFRYPEALADLWFGDRREGLDNLRDFYLQRVRQQGVLQPRPDALWFTDKMPLNETHLGLVALIFPQAPLIHLLRHPLDVVLSVYANQLTHGFYCAYALESIARHYVLIADLVEHYRREMSLRYLAVRYEDIVADQETHIRALLGFIGAPFDARCLSFHENRRYARTASYAQVTEPLHDRSRYRYRAYRRELAPVVPLLEPVIARLGYRID
jgi:tetratricopeptide (TPR) repeat protein